MKLQIGEEVSAPERAYQWIRQLIMRSPYDEESFLSENAIADASQTSRTPVREALLRLEGEGLLRRIPRRGAFIPALTKSDIDEIMEVREVIGSWATHKVTAEHPDIADTLDAIITQQEENRHDVEAFIQLDVTFHKTIVRAAGNKTLGQLYDSQRVRQERLGVQAVLSSEHRIDAVLHEHRAIVDGIRSGQPDAAAEASNAHVASTRSVLRIPSVG